MRVYPDFLLFCDLAGYPCPRQPWIGLIDEEVALAHAVAFPIYAARRTMVCQLSDLVLLRLGGWWGVGGEESIIVGMSRAHGVDIPFGGFVGRDTSQELVKKECRDSIPGHLRYLEFVQDLRAQSDGAPCVATARGDRALEEDPARF